MRCWAVVALLFGCGRLGFDASATADASGDGPAGTLHLSYPTDHVIAVLGATAVSLTATVDAPASFAVSPALPTGLALDAGTGLISGVPTLQTDADFVVIATAGAAMATALVHIQALPG